MRIYAYEIYEWDKGIIVAESLDEAKKIFHEEYPEKEIVDNLWDYDTGGAFVYEVDEIGNSRLYCCFPY